MQHDVRRRGRLDATYDIDSLSEEELIELNHKVVTRLRFLNVRTPLSIDDDTFRLVKRYERAVLLPWERPYPNSLGAL